MDGLLERQQAVGEWSAEQFGTEQPAWYPMLGAGEELGELTTSVLKRAQGIDDSEKYADRVGDDAERDAVADVAIYLFDFVYRCDLVEMESVIDVYDELVFEPLNDGRADGVEIERDVINMYRNYGDLVDAVMTRHDNWVDRCTARLLVNLKTFCDDRCFDFEACLDDALDDVLNRSWDADMST